MVSIELLVDVLIEFQREGKNYLVDAIMDNLELSLEQLTELVRILKDKGYIKYDNYELVVTDAGREYIISHKQKEGN